MSLQIQNSTANAINYALIERNERLEKTCEAVMQILAPSGYKEIIQILANAIGKEVSND